MVVVIVDLFARVGVVELTVGDMSVTTCDMSMAITANYIAASGLVINVTRFVSLHGNIAFMLRYIACMQRNNDGVQGCSKCKDAYINENDTVLHRKTLCFHVSVSDCIINVACSQLIVSPQSIYVALQSVHAAQQQLHVGLQQVQAAQQHCRYIVLRRQTACSCVVASDCIINVACS